MKRNSDSEWQGVGFSQNFREISSHWEIVAGVLIFKRLEELVLAARLPFIASFAWYLCIVWFGMNRK